VAPPIEKWNQFFSPSIASLLKEFAKNPTDDHSDDVAMTIAGEAESSDDFIDRSAHGVVVPLIPRCPFAEFQ
jgi:hypothetical protein